MAIDTIHGTITNGVTLTSGVYGNPVTIASDANISASGTHTGVLAQDPWAIQNSGTVSGGNQGIWLKGGGSVTNDGSGSIAGQSGIYIGPNASGVASTVDNQGTITGTGTYGTGVLLTGNYGTITNGLAGTITGAAVGVQTSGALNNDGTIATADSGKDGVFLTGGSITNGISGLITGGQLGVYVYSGIGMIDNAGTIDGGLNTPGFGGGLLFGQRSTGTLVNEFSGTINGSFAGVGVSFGVTIVNSGTITGDQAIRDFGSSVTNNAGGLIEGQNAGVYMQGASSLFNAGTIAASGYMGVDVRAGADGTIENSGTIGSTAYAVRMDGYTNLLIVDAGAVFDGAVYANATSQNTLELTSGASAGTIAGLGTKYTGFQTVTIDSGASWTIAGKVAGLRGSTIASTIGGFTASDRLDLTNLGFAAGDTATLNATTDVLTIEDINHTALGTVQLAGDFTGDFFHLADDGHGGTYFTENDSPAGYCRGTAIATDRGPVAVEDLKVGDRLITVSGEALPLKWIGRRSYVDWLAVGNPDVQPIRFTAGSLADNIPARDLLVSPEHAMFLDSMLVPAHLLVNGISITKAEAMEEIHYFHLELDRHAVIFAEGAASESFVDDDSRGTFHNAHEFRALYPNASTTAHADYCAPRVEHGYELEAIRRRLAARANRLLPDGTAAFAPALQGYLDCVTRTSVEGWAFSAEPQAGPVALAILANGAVIGRTVANLNRADLAGAGIGYGNHAFRFELPQGFATDVCHEIQVRRESDWSQLDQSPRILESRLAG